MCTEQLPPGGYPIAVNKYIIYQAAVPTITVEFTDPRTELVRVFPLGVEQY
jgi:hypothetical protein